MVSYVLDPSNIFALKDDGMNRLERGGKSVVSGRIKERAKMEPSFPFLAT